MKKQTAAWFFLAVFLISALPAAAIVPPKPGRYRGSVSVEFATADGKSKVKQVMPAFALLLADNTLQLVMPHIPDLPDWKTRQPDGLLSLTGTAPTEHLFWQTFIGGQTYGMNGLSTANAFTLSYSGDPDEPGSSHLATFVFTIKMTRTGPLP